MELDVSCLVNLLTTIKTILVCYWCSIVSYERVRRLLGVATVWKPTAGGLWKDELLCQIFQSWCVIVTPQTLFIRVVVDCDSALCALVCSFPQSLDFVFWKKFCSYVFAFGSLYSLPSFMKNGMAETSLDCEFSLRQPCPIHPFKLNPTRNFMWHPW